MTDTRLIVREVRTIQPKKALFGLIEWEEVVKVDTLGTELHIKTTADTIFVNGKEVKLWA